MAIAGVGTDLVRIGRFRDFLHKEKTALIDRLFTSGEKAYALARKDPAPHLAARFAAKEAFLKALGLGLREGITWHDMAVERDDLGKPSLALSGCAAQISRQRRIDRVHLTYSHDGDYAQAVVILEEL